MSRELSLHEHHFNGEARMQGCVPAAGSLTFSVIVAYPPVCSLLSIR